MAAFSGADGETFSFASGEPFTSLLAGLERGRLRKTVGVSFALTGSGGVARLDALVRRGGGVGKATMPLNDIGPASTESAPPVVDASRDRGGVRGGVIPGEALLRRDIRGTSIVFS